jgi:hypothetical protein
LCDHPRTGVSPEMSCGCPLGVPKGVPWGAPQGGPWGCRDTPGVDPLIFSLRSGALIMRACSTSVDAALPHDVHLGRSGPPRGPQAPHGIPQETPHGIPPWSYQEFPYRGPWIRTRSEFRRDPAKESPSDPQRTPGRETGCPRRGGSDKECPGVGRGGGRGGLRWLTPSGITNFDFPRPCSTW